MSGRAATPLTPEQQQTKERIAALNRGNVAALQEWARKWGIEPLASADDTTLIERAMHEARVDDPGVSSAARIASRRWLRLHAPNSVSLLTDRAIARRLK